jgi:hypothetical protein
MATKDATPKYENRSNSHTIDLDSTFLQYFNSNMDTDSDILKYECKTDTSDSNLDIYLMYKSMVGCFVY